jgi:hypothetical protein
MQASRYILLFFFSTFSFIAAQSQEPVLHARDSVITLETDATTNFFRVNEKTTRPDKIVLVTKARKTISLSSFLKDLGQYADHVLADLDNDGKKELLVYNYTAGAHCCDEIYIFKNTAVNKYQHAAKLFAGNTVIGDSNKFYYNFHEQYGYFFTCYACGYVDTADDAAIKVRSIELKYKKGAMVVTRGDQELRSKINDNLGKLAEIPYEKFDVDGTSENGVRKEFALNLIIYYYSFGKNITETQRLFNKYYKFPDARKVWAEFLKTLNSIKKGSDI